MKPYNLRANCRVTTYIVVVIVLIGVVLCISRAKAQTDLGTSFDVSSLRSLSDDNLSRFVKLLDETPTIPAAEAPRSSPGGFFSLQNPSWPPLPMNLRSNDVWSIGNGRYLLNDLDTDYTVSSARSGMQMMSLDGPPGFDDIDTNSSGGGGYTPLGFPGIPYTNGLWLEIFPTPAVDTTASLILHGTTNEDSYEILSREDLLSESWNSEGLVSGAPNQDWTAFSILKNNRAHLFIWARDVTIDSDAQGLPDWWQLQYFGTTGVDPYGDADGDGWNNIQEFRNGTSPVGFDTPPPPQNLTARLNGGNAVLTWQPGGGPVSYYTVESGGIQISGNISGNTFTDTQPPLGYAESAWTNEPPYQVRAHYGSGASHSAGSIVSAPVQLKQTLQWNSDVHFFLQSTGTVYAAFQNPPANLSKIRFFEFIFGGGYTYFDVYMTNMVNGLIKLSADGSLYGPPLCFYYFRLFDTNDNYSAWVDDDIISEDGSLSYSPRTNFVNEAAQMKQNLKFLLKCTTTTLPFGYANVLDGGGEDFPETAFARPRTSGFYRGDDDGLYTNVTYEYYGFHVYSEHLGYSVSPLIRPTQENYLWENFSYDPADFSTDGILTNGAFSGLSYWGMPSVISPAKNRYTGSPSLAMTTTNSPWLLTQFGNGTSFPEDMGLAYDENWDLYLPSGARNVFGLPINSILFVSQYGPPVVIEAGGDSFGYNYWYVYAQAADPILTTVDYFFTSQTPHFNGFDQPLIVPGSTNFSTTNISQPLIASLGELFTVMGYAKLCISNGYAGKFAYLEQYFDKAYIIGTNGAVTTNEAGPLSPYGEFYPMQAGKAALVTMPDIDTGQRGTAIVQVVAINVDNNHDGTMDFSFNGPDSVSADRPFRFWVNDDNDSGDTGGDDIPGKPASFFRTPNGLDGEINGPRDLVDFFPIYLNIQGLLQSTNGVTCWLKQDDEALNYVDPDSYADAVNWTPTNCLAYLTDTNVAHLLAHDTPPGYLIFPNASTYQITSNGIPLSFSNPNFITGIRDNGRALMLIEARKPTTKPLVLEVRKGTNMLVHTELPLCISGVEQMFRQKNLIREVDLGSEEGDLDRLTPESVPNEPENNGKNFVFLHGYNVNPEQARGTFAETFKRMYWSGSHAKFYGVNWKGSSTQGDIHLPGMSGVTANYDTNVGNAFLEAPKLADFLGTLTNQTIVVAHSLGNMVVLSALNDWNARIDKYFMLDAAVSIEAIDGSAVRETGMVYSDWQDYNRRLYADEWHSMFSADDARSTLTWSNRLANLRNADVYNFYSFGEEVLREYPDDPPSELLSSVPDQAAGTLVGAQGSYAWVWQEKSKGRAASDDFLGSTHGGWLFNPTWDTNSSGGHLAPSLAAALTSTQLGTNSFFNPNAYFGSHADAALLGVNGSQYAQDYRNRILADAIPALTLPVGANPVTILDQPGNPHNFNMSSIQFQNGWPAERLAKTEGSNWHHSDFREVAYLYTHLLFDKFVTLGELK